MDDGGYDGGDDGGDGGDWERDVRDGRERKG